MDARSIITKRIAQDFRDGMLVNLGIGLPTAIPRFLPPGVSVWLESENGIVGFGPPAAEEEKDPFFIDASKVFTTILPGGPSSTARFPSA